MIKIKNCILIIIGVIAIFVTILLFANKNSKDSTASTIKSSNNKKSKIEGLCDIESINSDFVPNIHPIKGNFEISSHFSEEHKATDYSCKLREDVFSTAHGVVYEIGVSVNFGKFVKVNHLNGYKSFYAHLDSIFVNENIFVSNSVKIGLSGNSGHSTGPHLHYEVMHNNIKLDAFKLIEPNLKERN